MVRRYVAITAACALGDSPSRVAFLALGAQEMPPALVVEVGFTCPDLGVNP